jgi:hypothetical protein
MARNLPLVAAAVAVCLNLGTAWGGANRDGALIVHADPQTSYSSGNNYCGSGYRGPASCSTATTDVDGFTTDAILVWFIAAFPGNASPAVNAIQFGVTTTISRDAIVARSPCGTSVLELADQDFPSNYTGTLVSFSTIRSTFSPVYWFAVAGTGGDTFGSTYYPGDGRAVFVDDGSPPAEDEFSRFGKVGWGTSGSNDCPVDAYETRASTWGKVKEGYR